MENILFNIQYFLYLLFAAGFYVTFEDSFFESMHLRKARRVNARKTSSASSPATDRLSEYLSEIMQVINGDGSLTAVKLFYRRSLFTALMCGIVAYIFMTPKVILFAFSIGAFLPFLSMRIRLQEVRNKTSREGEVLVQEVLSNYKIYHKNMREAVRGAIETIGEDAPHSKKLLIELSYSMNAASDREIKKAVERFKFGINTTWAVMFATNLELSLIEGLDVVPSMEDLTISISKARKALEETKRQGNEGNKMLRIIVPLIYLLTVFAAIFLFGMTPHEFYHNQFKTPTGSAWFLAVVISYIFSLLISLLISKDKMDI